MSSRPKLLILDDDQDFLDVCQQLLSGLPSHPEIQTATSGSKALTLLESEPFSLLLTDLRMPKMDGFQVLAIVRRRLPSLRILVMTGATDEPSRARAYAMGIDLFVEKPKSKKETQLFFECIESMLERDSRQAGFRGVVEHKALVDIIQMECLTQSSAVLKISSGKEVGYIWFKGGEIIDAATATAKAEKAFREILSWKVGNFDLLPPEPTRSRSIFISAQGLLLDSAQALDESAAVSPQPSASDPKLSKLGKLAHAKGVEFLLTENRQKQVEHASCENADAVAAWAQRMLHEFRALGTAIKVSGPSRIVGYGPQRHVAIASLEKATLVAGFDRGMEPRKVEGAVQQLIDQWGS